MEKKHNIQAAERDIISALGIRAKDKGAGAYITYVATEDLQKKIKQFLVDKGYVFDTRNINPYTLIIIVPVEFPGSYYRQ